MFKRFFTSAVIFTAGFALCAVIWGGSLASFAKGNLSSHSVATTQSPQPRTVWEYTWTGNAKDLNRLGAQGWELVGISDDVSISNNLGSSTARFYLKRAK